MHCLELDGHSHTNEETYLSVNVNINIDLPELVLIANCNYWEIQFVCESDVDTDGFLMPTQPEYIHYNNVDQNRCGW